MWRLELGLGLVVGLLDPRRVDAPVLQQLLERHARDLAAHAVEAGEDDRVGRVVDDEVDAGEVLQRADVAALAADDAALHVVGWAAGRPRPSSRPRGWRPGAAWRRRGSSARGARRRAWSPPRSGAQDLAASWRAWSSTSLSSACLACAGAEAGDALERALVLVAQRRRAPPARRSSRSTLRRRGRARARRARPTRAVERVAPATRALARGARVGAPRPPRCLRVGARPARRRARRRRVGEPPRGTAWRPRRGPLPGRPPRSRSPLPCPLPAAGDGARPRRSRPWFMERRPAARAAEQDEGGVRPRRPRFRCAGGVRSRWVSTGGLAR